MHAKPAVVQKGTLVLSSNATDPLISCNSLQAIWDEHSVCIDFDNPVMIFPFAFIQHHPPRIVEDPSVLGCVGCRIPSCVQVCVGNLHTLKVSDLQDPIRVDRLVIAGKDACIQARL